MISAWHLLWIIPVCSCLSMLATGLCGVNARHELCQESYYVGLQDGRNEAKNNGNQT